MKRANFGGLERAIKNRQTTQQTGEAGSGIGSSMRIIGPRGNVALGDGEIGAVWPAIKNRFVPEKRVIRAVFVPFAIAINANRAGVKGRNQKVPAIGFQLAFAGCIGKTEFAIGRRAADIRNIAVRLTMGVGAR